jgi:hypothetical protein
MDEMADYRPQWEHHIEYITTDARNPQVKDFLATRYPGYDFPKYAAQAAKIRLDELGAHGWELVHMEPVELGVNGDVRIGGEMASWTNTYLCVFKRLKRSAQS